MKLLVGLLLALAGTLAAPPPPASLSASKKALVKPAKRAALYPTVYSYPLAYVSPLPPLTAVADLTSYGEGEVKGRIMLIQPVGGAVIMKGNITGLSPGAHGIHVHELGDLSDGCNSLGAHYNPTLNYHGGPADPYRHVGDLGNVVANEEGAANISESDHLISLNGPHSIVGRGLVIHSGKDDFGRGGDKESLRTGNSGGRVACGVIAWALPPGLTQNGGKKEPDSESVQA